MLALGIASSLLLTAVALLPAGMDATRAAEQTVTEAAIVESLRTQIEEGGETDGLRYFDGRGIELSERTADAAFIARVELASDGAILNESGPAMRRLRILISDRPQEAAFGDARHTHVYHLLLSPAP